MDTQFKKHFTLVEAIELLPRLVSLLNRIEERRAGLDPQAEQIEKIHRSGGGNGGGEGAIELLDHSVHVAELLENIADLGVVVKDLDQGLLDFPHLREGREVFLCWKKGERTIDFWHELNTGFKGRQPL